MSIHKIIPIISMMLIYIIYFHPTAFYGIFKDVYIISHRLYNFNDSKSKWVINYDSLTNEYDIPIKNRPGFTKVILKKKHSIRHLEFNNKENSLTSQINLLVTPLNYNGTWKADSIFRLSCNTVENMKLKKIYIQAFTYHNLQHVYSKMINQLYNDVLSDTNDIYPIIINKNCQLFWLLHIGRYPNSYEYNFIHDMFNTINRMLSRQLYSLTFDKKMMLWRTDTFFNYFKNLEINEDCIVKFWLDNGASREYCYIEMMHNVFAMPITWSVLLFNYFDLKVDNNIQEDVANGDYFENHEKIKLYLHHVIHMIMPASVISSSHNNELHIHNLNIHKQEFNPNYKNQTLEKKCPYKTCIDNSNSLVPRGIGLNSKDDTNVAFGIGCRRCPGEELTLLYFYYVVKFYEKNKKNLSRVTLNQHICGLGHVSWFTSKNVS